MSVLELIDQAAEAWLEADANRPDQIQWSPEGNVREFVARELRRLMCLVDIYNSIPKREG